jgi:hypothetical protein
MPLRIGFGSFGPGPCSLGGSLCGGGGILVAVRLLFQGNQLPSRGCMIGVNRFANKDGRQKAIP